MKKIMVYLVLIPFQFFNPNRTWGQDIINQYAFDQPIIQTTALIKIFKF